MRAISKGNTASYTSPERPINADFEKIRIVVGFLNPAEEKCKNDRENDHSPFNQINELIGYQNSADVCEIWSERSLHVVKPKCVGDF